MRWRERGGYGVLQKRLRQSNEVVFKWIKRAAALGAGITWRAWRRKNRRFNFRGETPHLLLRAQHR